MKRNVRISLVVLVSVILGGAIIAAQDNAPKAVEPKPATLVGKPMRIGAQSTPLCTSMEKLKQFVAAIGSDSADSATSICWMGKEGMQIDVLDDFGSYGNSDYGHALHVNVVGGGTTIPAYTLSSGIVPR